LSAGDKKGFFLGNANNFQEVFGDNKLLWFIPVFSSFGDGLVFPQRGQALDDDPEMGLPHVTVTGSGQQSNGHHGTGSAEEMVPMINATQFEDDESDEDNMTIWTDKHNQRTTMASGFIRNGSGNTSVTTVKGVATATTSGGVSTKLSTSSSSDTSSTTTMPDAATAEQQQSMTSSAAAVLNVDDQASHAQVSLRSPRQNRFDSGANTSTAVTGDLITVDTI